MGTRVVQRGREKEGVKEENRKRRWGRNRTEGKRVKAKKK